MFGERYFATRERLSEVMTGIAALAAEIGLDVSEQLPLAELAKGACPPFLFTVCGDVNAGKSTLINGLFGREFCRVSKLPETKQVTWYRYGDSVRELQTAPMLEERLHPVDFLRDFNFIDTPGINAALTGHLPAIERFLPTADLIIFVFAASNPWGAATWNFIARLSAESLAKVAFVVQQIDQCAATDIEVILGHLRDLALNRIGFVPPLFAVSGKLACEAKLAIPFASKQFADSGFPALESFISKCIYESPSRNQLLETWRVQASAALRSVDDQIENRTRRIYFQGNFLEDIESEIDAMREQLLRRLPSHLAGVAQVFQSESAGVAKLLGKRLALLPSVFRLFVGDRTSQEVEAVFIGRLQATVEAVAEADGEQVVAVCRNHWLELEERVRRVMGVELGDPHEVDEILAVARRRFVQRLGRAASQGIGNLKVRNQLGKDIRRRNVALKSFTFMMLLLLAAGATCGALLVPWAPWILCGLSLVFGLAGMLIGWLTRRSLVADFKERLLDTCGAYANTLRLDYEEALRIVFQDYVDSLGAIRRHLATEKQGIEPRQRRWKEWFLTLKAIEQDL
jgi:GTPase SAR1 family protein